MPLGFIKTIGKLVVMLCSVVIVLAISAAVVATLAVFSSGEQYSGIAGLGTMVSSIAGILVVIFGSLGFMAGGVILVAGARIIECADKWEEDFYRQSAARRAMRESEPAMVKPHPDQKRKKTMPEDAPKYLRFSALPYPAVRESRPD